MEFSTIPVTKQICFVVKKQEILMINFMNKYRVGELFAGIGGIGLGFKQAGFELIWANEIDEKACVTYSSNFNHTLINEDMKKINPHKLPAIDILTGGFPCQAFSMAGKHGGFKDNYKGMCRGTLFQDVVRICEYHKSKVIFCENVKGLLIHDRGNTFDIIKKSFEEIGYNVFYKILNSKDFGVPQNRERIYIVCFRKNLNIEHFDFPVGRFQKTSILDILDPAPICSKYYLSDVYIVHKNIKKNKKIY